MNSRCVASLFVAAFLLMPDTTRAQIRASELASFTQMIDGTKLGMTYSRPRVRGRDTLFGTRKAVRWDEVWTPGANYATTLEVSRAIRLDGHVVQPRTYSVWIVVRESGKWTMVLDTNVRVFHMEPPDSSASQIRFAVTPRDAPFMEVLTWWMPELRANGGTLAMQWGRTRVDMNVEVEPSLKVQIAEADAKPYLGTYEYEEKDEKVTPRKRTFFIVYESGTLKGYWDPVDRYMGRFALIRITGDWFVPGLYDDKGQIYEVLRPDMVFEFKRSAGRATSFVVRYDDDKVWATGTRQP